MEKIVLIVNGNPGSGKTTVENLIAEKVPSMIHSSIDIVKDIAIDYFDWDSSKNVKSRKFLSDMKIFLNASTDIIEHDLLSVYEEFGYSDSTILMIDIREPHEIRKYAKKFNAKTIFIDNPRTIVEQRNKSDAQVVNFQYDYIIKNDSDIECLEETIDTFLLEVLKLPTISTLYFQTSRGTRKSLGKVTSMQDINQKINIFLTARRYISHYSRYWLEDNGEIKIDVGSYSEFFFVTHGKKIFQAFHKL